MNTYDDAARLTASTSNQILHLDPYMGSRDDLQYLRSYVLDAVTGYYGIDAGVFDSANLYSITLLRDWAHRAFYASDTDQLGYQALYSRGQIPVYSSDVGTLFRYPGGGPYCGASSFQLYAIAKSFGWIANRIDTIDGEYGNSSLNPDRYGESHVINEIYSVDLNKFIVVDPTFNTFIKFNNDYLDYFEVRKALSENQNLSHVTTGSYTYVSSNSIWENLLIIPDATKSYIEGAYKVPASWVSTQGSWLTFGTGASYVYKWGDVHSQVAPDAYVNLAAAIQEIIFYKNSNLDWESFVTQMAGSRDLAGIRFVDTNSMQLLGSWVTVGAQDGYYTINYERLQVISGSYDEIIMEIMSGMSPLDTQTQNEFLSPFQFITNQGQIGSWSRNLVDESRSIFFGSNLADSLVGSINADIFYGYSGNDSLWGYDGGDRFFGGDGNDYMVGGLGADYFDGGSGSDIVSYYFARAGLTARLDASRLNTGEAAGDQYVGVESLYGSQYGDTLCGNSSSNLLYGWGGNDTFMFDLNGFGNDIVVDFDLRNDSLIFFNYQNNLNGNNMYSISTITDGIKIDFLNSSVALIGVSILDASSIDIQLSQNAIG